MSPAGAAAPEPEADAARPAYHLQAGSVARSRVVALGRDMQIDGEALSHAVVVGGEMRITGRVVGDVLVLEGDVQLSPSARVEGDVFVLGGALAAAPGAAIGGRSVAYPDASAVWLSLIESPSLGLPASSAVVVGAKLALLAFWAILVLLLMSIGRRELLSTSESVRIEPFRNFFVGLVGILAMTLTALFFSAISGAILGLPLLILVVVTALLLRFWGMVAVFHALGEWAFRAFKVRPPLPLSAAVCGLVLLGLLKFLPWVGVTVWSTATFIGVGAALSTKLGRREAWFEAA